MIVVPTRMSVKSLVGIPLFALTLQMLFEYGSSRSLEKITIKPKKITEVVHTKNTRDTKNTKMV